MADPMLDIDIDIDIESGAGVAAQLRDRIAYLIADGVLQEGDRLPALRAMATHLGIHVNTVRAAYRQLAVQGVLKTRHGVGTVVADTQPVGLAAATWRGRSNTVGVLIAGLDPFYLPLLRAIEDVMDERGTLVVTADGRDDPDRSNQALRQMVARGVDGLIAASIGHLPPHSGESGRLPPIVYIDQPQQSGHIFVFDSDAAGEQATHHLLRDGHRRIALITVPDTMANLAGLKRGYLHALEAHPDRPPCTVVEIPGLTVADGREGAAQVLDGHNQATAVLTASSLHAQIVVSEAHARGLRVPQDLAVIGYGDTLGAELAALSMVSLSAEEVGARAARLLQELVNGVPHQPRRRTIRSRLIIRSTCGPHT